MLLLQLCCGACPFALPAALHNLKCVCYVTTQIRDEHNVKKQAIWFFLHWEEEL